MKLAPGWRTDLDKVPRGGSVLLACTYSEHPTSWIRGEAVLERESDGGQWYWANGKPIAPDYVPRAWMDMPAVIADDVE